MIPVHIDYSDGQYWLTRAEEDKFTSLTTPTTITPELWAAYELHQQACAVWHRILSKLDNEAYETEAARVHQP